MSPITRTKLNISNLIAETQRIITNSNTNKNTQVQNSEINSPKINYNLNKENQFITDLYRSFSSNRPNIISNKHLIILIFINFVKFLPRKITFILAFSVSFCISFLSLFLKRYSDKWFNLLSIMQYDIYLVIPRQSRKLV